METEATLILNHLSAALAGFSVVSALILLAAYLLFLPDMRKSFAGKVACCFILLSLALLQVCHYGYFAFGTDLLNSRLYGTVLVFIPPGFFFFSREILFPVVRYHWYHLLHWLPVIVSFFLPTEFLPSLGFTFGTAYTFWIAITLLKLRGSHDRFKFEIFFFVLFALMALIALVLGLALPYLDPKVFFITYSNAISIAMVLIVAALLFFPALLSDIMVITELAYAKSKLSGVDVERKLAKLERLMVIEKHYENEGLNLSATAELLDLSSHQLSELINTKFGYGFPRFVRVHRIQAAKALLISEPNASVLSISMMTGFKSQSNFYTAFKQETGEKPASYRARKLR